MNRTAHPCRFAVTVRPTDASPGNTHLWDVDDHVARMSHCGYAPSREVAWTLALSALRGMIALARVRNLP